MNIIVSARDILVQHGLIQAAAEPHAAKPSPAQFLVRLYDTNPTPKRLKNGITLKRARRPGKGFEISIGNRLYYAGPDYLGSGTTNVRVGDVTSGVALHAQKPVPAFIVTDVIDAADLLRQILKPILARHQGGQATASATPAPSTSGPGLVRDH